MSTPARDSQNPFSSEIFSNFKTKARVTPSRRYNQNLELQLACKTAELTVAKCPISRRSPSYNSTSKNHTSIVSPPMNQSITRNQPPPNILPSPLFPSPSLRYVYLFLALHAALLPRRRAEYSRARVFSTRSRSFSFLHCARERRTEAQLRVRAGLSGKDSKVSAIPAVPRTSPRFAATRLVRVCSGVSRYIVVTRVDGFSSFLYKVY